jgi:hypothetical protein
MSARLARHATSTALAAAVLLLLAPGAMAAPPTCAAPQPAQTVQTGAPLFIPASCTDTDGDELSFEITTVPEHGDAAVDFDGIVYTPTPPYTGSDQLAFTATDGTDTTDPVTVDITVVENPPPVCATPLTLKVEPGEPAFLFPFETCSDEQFPTFTVVTLPAHGDVDLEVDFTYAPDPGFVGTDRFTFVANDGVSDSNLVTVDVIVRHNNPPHCVTPLSINVEKNGASRLNPLTACSDRDGDAISPELIAGPEHGQLELNLPSVTYRPNRDYTGPDLIVYRVRDDRGAGSNIALLNITVGPIVNPSDRVPPTVDLAADGKQKLRAVRRQGLKLKVTCNELAFGRIEVWVGKSTARKLKIRPKARGPVRIGWVSTTIASGESRITVELGRKARKRLKSARKVKLVVTARVADEASNVSTDRLKMTLRR